MNDLTSRLYTAWNQAIKDQKIMNQFEAEQDDIEGRWVKSDRIIYGLTHRHNQPTYYAHNLTQKVDIPGTIKQRPIAGTSYLCQLNSYRTLRPGGSVRQIGRQPEISAEAAQCRFHCQNSHHPLSLLRRQPLLRVPGEYCLWQAYYNVAPLEPKGHFLWIPTPLVENALKNNAIADHKNASPPPALPHWTQRLTPALIQDVVQLFNQLKNTIVYFNGIRAGASVNHIHLQSVYAQKPLPIATAPTTHYKGYQLLSNSLIEAVIFSAKQPLTKLISYIEGLQYHNIPFNLALLSERIVVIARDQNHEMVSELPRNGMAALELCGRLTVIDRGTFNALDRKTLKSALNKMVIPAKQIIDGNL